MSIFQGVSLQFTSSWPYHFMSAASQGSTSKSLMSLMQTDAIKVCVRVRPLSLLVPTAAKNSGQQTYGEWKISSYIISWYGKYPIIYRVSYVLGGAGFLPWTVAGWKTGRPSGCCNTPLESLRAHPRQSPVRQLWKKSLVALWERLLGVCSKGVLKQPLKTLNESMRFLFKNGDIACSQLC